MISHKNKRGLLFFKKNSQLILISRVFVFFLFLPLVLLTLLKVVFAQSLPPVVKDVKVTATIPDIVPPSTPILISPEDGSNLDNAYPVFQWYASTDNLALSHYQFILDGRVWFDNIPLLSFANDDYSLNYDNESKIYTLVAKTPLVHGNHDWQIIAYDYGENQAASTTWSFNVFIDDPSFTIQNIGDKRVRISANDPESVPIEPISLFATDPAANEPWIIAFGDPNLRVDLTVSIPNRDSLFYSEYTDDDGNWQLQLGILPRDLVIKLDFVISDVVDHKSYIRELYIIILQHYWPASPMPSGPMPTSSLTGTPATILPTGISNITPQVSQVSIAPTAVLPSPGIRIPIIPPRELVHEAIEEVKESLPSKIATAISNFTRSPIWQSMTNFFALFLALLLPLISYIVVLSKFFQFLSIKTLREVLMALWPWSRRRKNLVFEYRQSQAAPLVRIELIDAETKELIDWQITNYLGQFFSFAWPSDQALLLKVQDKNFYFPVGGNKPLFLSWDNFYQGESFFLKKNKTNQLTKDFNPQRALAIPTLLAQGKQNLSLIERIRIILSYLLTYPWWFWFISFVPVLMFAILHPSFLNYLSLIYYFVIALVKYFYLSGSKIWQFKALFSNAYKLNQNLILVVNDLVDGFSQASVIAMNDSSSPKIHLLKDRFVFSLQAKDFVFWDGQRAISEAEYILNPSIISEFKLHPVDSANHHFKILQANCQLLPRQ